jgi:hypothetical protein
MPSFLAMSMTSLNPTDSSTFTNAQLIDCAVETRSVWMPSSPSALSVMPSEGPKSHGPVPSTVSFAE